MEMEAGEVKAKEQSINAIDEFFDAEEEGKII